MPDEPLRDVPAVPNPRPPASPKDASPSQWPAATQGYDWKAMWDALLDFIRGGRKLAGQLEATTQTPADDVLIGKVGVITAPVATGKTGEIRIAIRGGTQDYIACAQTGSNETMAINTTAEVVAFMPPNTVYVAPRK